MNVSITFAASDIDSLCEAVQRLRALGIAPLVGIAPATAPAPRRGAQEPNVENYLATRGETTFRLTKAEKQAGLSRDEAARLRMEGENWQRESVAQDTAPDEQPAPWDGGDTFE